MSEEKKFKTRAITNMPFRMAPVDIIIPFHNEHNRVARLIESIFSSIRTNRYQISLVDDASKNPTFIRQFKKVPGVVTFRQEKQLGFGAAVNRALAATKQPYVLILQSDVVVEGNSWLTHLGETLLELKDRGIKMVAPLTDNPVIYDPRLIAEQGQLKEETVALSTGYLPMYCVLCHRELFNRVGKLKELPYAGGEAEEFAYRMRANGFRQAVCGQSWVHHDGRGTLSAYDRDEKVQEILRKVRQELDEGLKSFRNQPQE